MTTEVRDRLPAREAFFWPVARGILVGATLLALGESLRFGAIVGGGTVLLNVALLLLRSAVGDYADHAALGALVLAGTGALAAAGTTLPWLAAGTLLGGWLLLDGVQRVRHGVERDVVVRSHDGGPLSGLVRALVARLLSPLRLSVGRE